MRFALLLLLSVSSFIGYAHGDLHQRILKLTEQIKEDPNNPQLYLKRGQLYYQHQEYENAEQDYVKTLQLDPDNLEVLYWEAMLYLDTKRTADGLKAAEACLKERPNDVLTLRAYAKLLVQDGRAEEAVKPLQQVLSFAEELLPENYLELSAVLTAMGKDTMAIVWLKKGIAEMGPVFTLKSALLERYKSAGMHTEAIEEYSTMAQHSARKETYYYEIAKLYLLQNNKQQAAVYLQKAQIALESLPWHLQMTDAMKQLNADIESTRQKL